MIMLSFSKSGLHVNLTVIKENKQSALTLSALKHPHISCHVEMFSVFAYVLFYNMIRLIVITSIIHTVYTNNC